MCHLFRRVAIWLCYCSPILIVSSSFLFLLFARIRIQSRFINSVGKSCLAAFIFHTCSPIIEWMSSLDTQIFLNQSLQVWILSMFVIIGGVFTFSILIDKLRLFISHPIIKLAGEVDSYVSNKIN